MFTPQNNFTQSLKKKAMDKNGWIKVEERLPELETSVLLFYTIKDAPYIRVGWLVSVTTHSSGVYPEFVELGYEPSEPTHWMELPSPPKTEQDEKERP